MKTTTLIKKMARILEKKANILLKPYAITHGYTYFLMALFEKDGQNQTELQRYVGGIEHPTVVRTLDRMERDGLIKRYPNEKDRRSFLIYLTPKGKASEKPLFESAENLNQMLLKGFSEQEKNQLNSLLNRLIHNIENS